MPAVLIGAGPNQIEIPAMVFESVEAGTAFVTEKLGRSPGTGRDGAPYWILPGDTWNHHTTEKIERGNPVGIFYTSYYSGCGECWCFYIQEVSFATPIVAWNLD